MRKFFAVMAMCGTMLAPMLGSAANAAITPPTAPTADGANSDTLALMESQCDAAAATYASGNDRYSAAVVEGASSLVSGPTEIGTHSINDAIGDPVGAGTFTPAHLEITGNPYRNGGSVNMFGVQRSVGGRYSASQYDFMGNFQTLFAYAYSCTILKETYHPAVQSARRGHWIVHPDFSGNEEAATNNCNAFNAVLPGGPSNGHPTDQANCQYIVDEEAFETPEYWDPAVVVAAGVPGGAINQNQDDELQARENNGEGFDTSETLTIGQVVVCISPSKSGTKLPGAWTAQNGYSGGTMGAAATGATPGCSTAWYNNGATAGVHNLNDGSHNVVTVPVV